jgi:hypothetical protein
MADAIKPHEKGCDYRQTGGYFATMVTRRQTANLRLAGRFPSVIRASAPYPLTICPVYSLPKFTKKAVKWTSQPET